MTDQESEYKFTLNACALISQQIIENQLGADVEEHEQSDAWRTSNLGHDGRGTPMGNMAQCSYEPAAGDNPGIVFQTHHADLFTIQIADWNSAECVDSRPLDVAGVVGYICGDLLGDIAGIQEPYAEIVWGKGPVYTALIGTPPGGVPPTLSERVDGLRELVVELTKNVNEDSFVAK